MKEEDYLNSVDWVLYLERETDLFIFAVFIEPYGKLLEKATGIGFKHQLHRYEGNTGIFYRSKKEMDEIDKHFAKLLDNNDKRIETWIEKEKEVYEKLDSSCKSDLDVRGKIDLFKEAILYNPVIPYRLLSGMRFTKKDHKEIQEILEEIRSRSTYPVLLTKLIHPLFDKVAEKLKIPRELTSLITHEELVDILEGEKTITRQELEQRKKGCYFYLLDDKIVFSYDEISSLAGEDHSKKDSVTGDVAFEGKATGRIRIINNPKSISKFEEGDILVSINTNPSLMPAIRKAAAIVTNEGGILCHAAVISRELKIPCIIGTKIATKVFKDGDVVEVDAEEGVVRKC
jgi:phosphohistidine swiveling domain-containing protein